MGRQDNTSISRNLRNSVGDETFCQWRGITVVKKKIKKNKSNTIAQQRQRTLWRTLMELVVLFSPSSALGFPRRKREHTGDNVFAEANANTQVITVTENEEATGEDDKWLTTVDFSKITCAKGTLRLPRQITMAYDGENNALSFTVGAETRGPRREEDDRLYAMVVETELMDSELFELCTRGEGGMTTANLPEGWVSTNLAVYLFVVSADGKKASKSSYRTVE